jgi:hypothetical protein
MFQNENVNYLGESDKKEKKKVNKMKDVFIVPNGQKSKIEKLEKKQKPAKSETEVAKTKSKLKLTK